MCYKAYDGVHVLENNGLGNDRRLPFFPTKISDDKGGGGITKPRRHLNKSLER